MTVAEPDGPTGLLVIDKPSGPTSHQVVGRLRRLLGTRRVGHAGTLDPMATGVLVVGVGRATRLLGHLVGEDKSYAATVRLGERTITDDAEGETVATADAGAVTDERIEAVLGSLRGPIEQVPSAVSAIKVDGVRSYARVRSGEQVGLAARPVTVSRLAVLATRRSVIDDRTVVDLDVAVDCSSGTYIRALARDLGDGLGVGGHLTRLRRTRVGPFTVDEARALDEPGEPLSMGTVAARCFATVELDSARAVDVRHGRRLDPGLFSAARSEPVAVFAAGEFLALYARSGRPVAVFA